MTRADADEIAHKLLTDQHTGYRSTNGKELEDRVAEALINAYRAGQSDQRRMYDEVD